MQVFLSLSTHQKDSHYVVLLSVYYYQNLFIYLGGS